MKNSFNNIVLMIGLLIVFSSFKPVFKVLSTSLKVTVLDELGNPAEGVEVTLFLTKEDYRAETNPIQTKVTDADGKVTFKKLKPIPYYVYASTADKSNIGSGVLTQELQEGKTNRVNTIIE